MTDASHQEIDGYRIAARVIFPTDGDRDVMPLYVDRGEQDRRALVPQRLDEEAPTNLVLPTGSRIPIDYAAEAGPAVEIRVQELFGLDRHPAIAGGKVPLTLVLTSPAHRPIQTTRDLPGFWRGSWKDVAKDLKGRYPKHPWPDDPIHAEATRRAKPRGT